MAWLKPFARFPEFKSRPKDPATGPRGIWVAGFFLGPKHLFFHGSNKIAMTIMKTFISLPPCPQAGG
jgi:hypothetical protein